jgi:hypothetical protein
MRYTGIVAAPSDDGAGVRDESLEEKNEAAKAAGDESPTGRNCGVSFKQDPTPSKGNTAIPSRGGLIACGFGSLIFLLQTFSYANGWMTANPATAITMGAWVIYVG